jgi:hypothetical protein
MCWRSANCHVSQAVENAVFAATGTRIRRLPIKALSNGRAALFTAKRSRPIPVSSLMPGTLVVTTPDMACFRGFR